MEPPGMRSFHPPGTSDPRTEQSRQFIASFLVGTSFATLTKCFALSFPVIYKILQDHFRDVMPKLENAIKLKDQGIVLANERFNRAQSDIIDLRAAIRAKDQETSVWMNTVGERDNSIAELTREHAESVRERDEQIEELLLAIEDCKQKELEQESEIQTLATQLAMRPSRN
jgi:septal ring factor EnvC (AmiA/AmiB activator)